MGVTVSPVTGNASTLSTRVSEVQTTTTTTKKSSRKKATVVKEEPTTE